MDQLDEHLKSMTPLQRAVFALRETQARLEALERKQRRADGDRRHGLPFSRRGQRPARPIGG